MSKHLLFAFAFLGMVLESNAQNVGIGTNNPQQKLDVTGNTRVTDKVISNGGYVAGTVTTDTAKAVFSTNVTNKGFYVPRLTTVEKNPLGSSLNLSNKGLIVFDTDLNQLDYWDGTAWKAVGDGIGGPPTGAAGGDLTGSYPNPTIANNAVNSAKVLDLSITGNDIQNNTIDLTQKVNNVLPVANGGTGVNTVTGIMQGNGSSPVSGLSSTGGSQYLRRNAGNTAYEFGQINYGDVAGTPSSLPPNGAAGGDLSGSYPNPTVDGLQGNSVSATVPTSGQVLKWNGSAWAPAADNNSGNVTGSGTTNYLPKWTSSSTLSSTSNIYDDGTNVGIGTTSPANKLEVRSDGTGATWAGRLALSNSSADRQVFLGTYNGNSVVASHNFALNAWEPLYVNAVSGTGRM